MLRLSFCTSESSQALGTGNLEIDVLLFLIFKIMLLLLLLLVGMCVKGLSWTSRLPTRNESWVSPRQHCDHTRQLGLGLMLLFRSSLGSDQTLRTNDGHCMSWRSIHWTLPPVKLIGHFSPDHKMYFGFVCLRLPVVTDFVKILFLFIFFHSNFSLCYFLTSLKVLSNKTYLCRITISLRLQKRSCNFMNNNNDRLTAFDPKQPG